MRRFVLFSVATLSLVGAAIGTSAVASGSTDTTVPFDAATEVHPVVGTWDLTDITDPENPSTFVGAFSGAGNYAQVREGSTALGVWEATGPTSATMTFTEQFSPDEGGGRITVRATIEVSPDGQTLTAEFTLEASGIEGAPTGEYGPGQMEGTRVVAEPMGPPVGPLDELFGDVEEGTEGTDVAEATGGTALAEGTEVAAPSTTAAAASPPASTASTGASGELESTLAAMWTTLLETPSAQNPFGSGGPAFACIDLGGTVAPFAGGVEFSCTVEEGTYLFVAGYSSECSTFEGNGETEAELRQCARDSDQPAAPAVTLDGEPVQITEAETPLLDIVLPADNIFDQPAGEGLSVGHGWVALLDPLTPGTHTIHGVVDSDGSTFTTTIVVEPSGAEPDGTSSPPTTGTG